MGDERFDSIFRPGLFDGQVVLVTGGGSGIGRCIAHELASLGATAVVAGRREEPLQQVAREIREAGGIADPVVVNIRDREAVDAAIADIASRHGRLDGVVNNAGGQFATPAGDLKPKGWLAVVDTNLNGTWWVSQAAYREALRHRGGSIVNIVADVWMGAPGMVHTGAARAGVMNMTVTLAAEWAREGVRVNAVAPGPILTGGLATYPEAIQRRALDEVCVTPPSRLGTESEGSGTTDVKGTGPLPYLYFEYRRLFSDHWRFNAGLGWLYVSIEDISGGQWIGRLGIEYLLGRHWALGGAVNFSTIDVDWDAISTDELGNILSASIIFDINDFSVFVRFRF